MKVLDSDKSEDEAEIEKNRKMIKMGSRAGANQNNINPKIKKRWKNLNWHFDRVEIMQDELPSNRYKPQTNATKPKRTTRFHSNHLRVNQKSDSS